MSAGICLIAVLRGGSSRLVVNLANGVDEGFRLVKLDVLRAVMGEDLFCIRR